MIDLKNPKLSDFRIVEATPHSSMPKARTTFFRAKKGSVMPNSNARYVTDMPKELYNEYFQKGI